jgi:hypothetical protein
MENRHSWQRMAVAMFDKATAKLGDDARQLQDAMSWLPRDQADGGTSTAAKWALCAQAEPAKP